MGNGITIFKPNTNLPKVYTLSVAQELIHPYLLNSTKFDFRIYALVATIDPLTIYVYRGGIARFCSEIYSDQSNFSYLTNTAINRQNPDVSLTSITKNLNLVLSSLERDGVNTESLWKEIDHMVIMTIISGIGFMLETAKKMRNPSRCFQLLGFDVLLGSDLHPKILEVNYRPSLSYDIPEEREMKVDLLSKLMQIVMTNWVDQEKISNLTKPKKREELVKQIQRTFSRETYPEFVLVYPPQNQQQLSQFQHIISK